jgi:hypothetical protein
MGSPLPFVIISHGFFAAPTAQSRQTPDIKEAEYSFNNSGDTGGAYAIWLTLSGHPPPGTLLP